MCNLKIDGSVKSCITLHVSRLQSISNEYLPSELNIVSGFSIPLMAQALCREVVKKQSVKQRNMCEWRFKSRFFKG